MAALVVSFRPSLESEDASAIHACIARYGAILCMNRQSVWVLRTDVPAERVFKDFKAALGPNTPLFVGVVGEVLTRNLHTDAEKLLGEIEEDHQG